LLRLLRKNAGRYYIEGEATVTGEEPWTKIPKTKTHSKKVAEADKKNVNNNIKGQNYI
jgi:hypothetical protein